MENQGICVPICGNSGGCSKDIPPPMVAYDQRALPITGIPGRSCAAGSPQADEKALPARAERPVQAHYVTNQYDL